MPAPIIDTPQLPPDAAAQHVAAHLGRVLGQHAPAQHGRLIRVETPVDGITPLAWLRANCDHTQYYWADRDGEYEMAGVGEADIVAPLDSPGDYSALFAHMRTRLQQHQPSLRYYGGFRFQPGKNRGERWKAFKAYRFVVPRIEVVRRGARTCLAVNARTGHPRTNAEVLEQTLEELARVALVNAREMPPPSAVAREDHPDRVGWGRLIEQALEAFAAGGLEKVVLARETCLTTSEPLDAASLLSRLIDQTTAAFDFCFHPAPDRAFIGSTPERLYRRINCYLQSEALASTRRRGKTDEEDDALAAELLASEKDRHEHRIVVDALRAALSPFCRCIEAEPKPSILRLRHVQHLHTRFQGILNDSDVDGRLIEALHPTPAVGGWPREEALAWIETHEPFDRGIYAGPVGWVGYDAAEFAVAIRSGLVQGNTLALYNGAGIVPGSAPEEEWDEIEHKMANFLRVLTGHVH